MPLLKSYWVLTPDNKEILINNLTKFCYHYKLDVSNMHKTARGLIIHHKGYKCRFYIEGKLPDFINQKQDRAFLTKKQVNQKINEYKKQIIKILEYPNEIITHWVCDPNNNHFLVTGLASFCKDNKLDLSSMYSVEHGKQNSHLGWICRLVDKNNQIISIGEN